MGSAMRSTARDTLLFFAILAVLGSARPAGAVLVHAVNSVSDRPHNGGSPKQCDTGFVIQLPSGTIAECTLRAAIESTRLVEGHDFIVFHPEIFINAQGFVVLRPNSALPSIGTPVTIDGRTVPGYDRNDPDQVPLVQIEGSGLEASGLRLATNGANGSEIYGLSLHDWGHNGIILDFASSITIQGCHTGIRFHGLARGNGFHGIYVLGGDNNTIGQAFSPSTGWTGVRNVASANGLNGIFISRGDRNLVAGNRVGTDPTGTFALPNGKSDGDGIRVELGTNNQIGGVDKLSDGTEVVSGNLISGNTRSGVVCRDFNIIQGNAIGVASNGRIPLGNGKYGIDADGCTGVIKGNTIADSGADGIYATGRTYIAANLVGTNAHGDAIGNLDAGIRIMAPGRTLVGSRFERMPDEIAAAANEIAFNGEGITVGSFSDPNLDVGRVFIRGNRLYSNDGIGIDLAADGRTPNDFGDPDAGPNRLQNFPDLLSLDLAGGLLDVRYRVNSSADACCSEYPLRIDFYLADADAQEGAEWIGSDLYPAAAAGTDQDVTLNVDPLSGLGPGDSMVATATSNSGDTSEFSDPVIVVPEPGSAPGLACAIGVLAGLSRVDRRQRRVSRRPRTGAAAAHPCAGRLSQCH